MSREAEKKRLIELLKCAREEMSKMFREKVEDCLAKKGSFNSKTDGDRQSIYEVEADYLLENGIIVPPCKVGDTVWRIGGERIYEEKVAGMMAAIEDEELTFVFATRMYHGKSISGSEFYGNDIGKTVFLSEAEAKYALKNRRSVSLVNGHIEE